MSILSSRVSDDEEYRLREEHARQCSLHRALPALPGLKGRSYYAVDSDGQWFYLNHANTWQTCPPIAQGIVTGTAETSEAKAPGAKRVEPNGEADAPESACGLSAPSSLGGEEA